MSAHCRCFCGCDKLDRQLNDETSSDLTCRLCLADRHLTEHPTLTERVIELEWYMRDLQKRMGVPIKDRLPPVTHRLPA